MEDERTLLEKLARGDRASFDALYMRYAAKTEEFLCRMLKNRAEAEDITHDLLLLIQLAVEKMPGQRQRIFRMSREEGIANDEIARRLGISTRTVENQISRALSELRKLVTLILFFF